jgi:hypothetical protein
VLHFFSIFLESKLEIYAQKENPEKKVIIHQKNGIRKKT